LNLLVNLFVGLVTHESRFSFLKSVFCMALQQPRLALHSPHLLRLLGLQANPEQFNLLLLAPFLALEQP
jgi:hypothetical protein